MTIRTFGPFRLATQDNLLFRGSEPVALGRRAVALLRALVERPRGVVSKDALIETAWPGQAVEESNLTVQIAAVRRVLSEAPGGDRWIETMPRRGYRFVGPIATSTENGVATEVEPVHVTPTPHAEAERRQSTAMSCELVSNPGQADGIDLEDWREAVGAFRHCVSETAERHDGFIHWHLGNDVLVLFGYPTAHEQDAEQAVRAGLQLCAAVRLLRPDADIPMRCRIGIATGMVIVGDGFGGSEGGRHEIIGDLPDLAARLRISTPPGMVAIEATTRRLIGDLFNCRELDALETSSGGGELMRRWQVAGESAVESRFEALRGPVLSPLIGRDEEIELLLRRWERAKAGNGQVVLISGEPGIGKSRLAVGLAERLQAEPYLRLRYFCSPYHQDTALHPFIAQLERAACFLHDDTPAQRLDKLTVLIAPGARDRDEVTLITDLLLLPSGPTDLELNPRRKREKLLAALLHQLDALARQQPVLMVVEDLHWIDPSSRELLDLIIERAANLPVLLILTFRPEFQAPWNGLPQVTTSILRRLDPHSSVAMVERIAGNGRLPDALVTEIVERADGVPLFVEELTRAVIEAGPGGAALAGAAPLPSPAGSRGQASGVPPALRASLVARLDRLGPAAREAAQTGAVLGREFPYDLIARVAQAQRVEADLQAALDGLTGAGLVFCRGVAPRCSYRFRHALIQDAAYETLVRARRQELHRAAAQTIAAEFAALAEAQPEVVAHHLTQAGLDEPAIEWWGKAGDQALRRSAFKEAAAHLGKAIELADKAAASAGTAPSAVMSSNRLRLQTSLGNALIWIKGFTAPETGAAFARARELASREEDASERFSAYYGLWVGHLSRSEPTPMREIAELFLREATARHNCPEAVIGHRISGQTCSHFGDFAGAHRHFQKTVELYDPACHSNFANRFGTDPHVVVEISDALALWALGRIDGALPLADRALADAKSAAHAPTMAYALSVAALLGVVRCNPEAVATYSQVLADIISRYDLPALWAGSAAVYQGWAKWSDGAEEAGLAEMRRGVAIKREQGHFWLLPGLEAALAKAEADTGETDSGLRRLDNALAELERTEQRWYEAEMHRIRAEILLKRDPANTPVAEQSLQTAIAIAQSQKARSFELRAALSLAKLYCAANRDADAHAVLAPAIKGFPPTQQFPELAEAQTLLSALYPQSIASDGLTTLSAASHIGEPADRTPVTASFK